MTKDELLLDLKQDITDLSNILYDIVTCSKENIWPDNDDYYKVVGLLEDIRNRYNN
jgi:hypothetical protein